MEGTIKHRFTLGRQSSLAPPSEDCNTDSSNTFTLPEKLDLAMQLLFLANKGDQEGISILINDGVDVNITDLDDRTALHVAACEGHAKVVSLLLKKGANANAQDRWGSTPLMDAKHYGKKEVCDILEKAGGRLPEISKKAPMQVSNPADVPEYEVPIESVTSIRRAPQLAEYKVAKWHGIDVLVKEIPGELSNQPQIVADFRDELALLQKLRHPNIVQFLGAVTQSTPMQIILEYCEGGDLHTYLQRKKRLELSKAVRYALDIARGLNYLHGWKPEAIVHHELKPSFIQACWHEAPSERPNFGQAIEFLERLKPLCDKQSFWRRIFKVPKRTLSIRWLSFK